MIQRTFVTLLASVLFVACADPGVDDSSVPGCEGKCDGFGDTAPIAGPESLLRCERGEEGDIRCDYVGVPESFPVDVSVVVSVVAGDESAVTELDEAGSVTLLRARESVPANVVVFLHLSSPLVTGDLASLVHASDLTAPGDETPDLPIPYEFWPVRLFAASGAIAVVEATQTLTLSPWDYERAATQEHDHDFPVVMEEPVDLLLPVLPGTRELTATATQYCDDAGCIEYDFVLRGPGVYRLDRDGATSLTGPAPTMDGGVDGGVDAGPPCGLNGAAPCEDGTCAEGQPAAGLCVMCGAEGQELCADADSCAEGHFQADAFCRLCGNDDQVACENEGARYCNEGHFHDLETQTCAACGADAQVACGDVDARFCSDGHFHDATIHTCAACGADAQVACEVAGERYCNEWHQHDVAAQTCSACGRDGQASCERSPGVRFCDEWHHHDRVNETCTVCGNDGQAACVNDSGYRFCNEGQYLNRSENTCAVCGDDGQVACINDSGYRFCNEGQYLNRSENTCAVCGDDGQVACVNDSGYRFCNEGQYLNRSENTCAVCGDDGQVACVNASGYRVCNEGFRVNSGMCVPE